jgi:hypothetical protein
MKKSDNKQYSTIDSWAFRHSLVRYSLLFCLLFTSSTQVLYAQIKQGTALVNFTGDYSLDRIPDTDRIEIEHAYTGRFFYSIKHRWALGMDIETKFHPSIPTSFIVQEFDHLLAPAVRFYFAKNQPVFLQIGFTVQHSGAFQQNNFNPGIVEIWRLGPSLGVGTTASITDQVALEFFGLYKYLNSGTEDFVADGSTWQASLHSVAKFQDRRKNRQARLQKIQKGALFFQTQSRLNAPGSVLQSLSSRSTMGVFVADGLAFGAGLTAERQENSIQEDFSERFSQLELFARYYRPWTRHLHYFPSIRYLRGTEKFIGGSIGEAEVQTRLWGIGLGGAFFFDRYTALDFLAIQNWGQRTLVSSSMESNPHSFLSFSARLVHYIRK